MTGEPSRSSFICQMDVWKTCIICGILNRKVQMRSFNKAVHLHILVAYLKFAEKLPSTRDFSTYDDYKTYECFVCLDHVDRLSKAVRTVYAFPPEVPIIDGKCDPRGFMQVLKEFMAQEYKEFSLDDLAVTFPDSKVPETRQSSVADCTCCKLLRSTRTRLQTVIENSDVLDSNVSVNFAVFEELMEVESSLNVIVEDLVIAKPKPLAPIIDEKKSDDTLLLLNFERRQNSQEKQLKPIGKVATPQNPSPPESYTNIRALLKTPKPENVSNRRKGSYQSIIPRLSAHPYINKFSPAAYSKLSPLNKQVNDCAMAVINCPLVVFTMEELRMNMTRTDTTHLHDALTQLEGQGLIHPHFVKTNRDELVVVYIKEFRRTHTSAIWKYGIIPEHYRQRLLGREVSAEIRRQVKKHRVSLTEMNGYPPLQGLVKMILSTSNLNDGLPDKPTGLGVENTTIRMRPPKLAQMESLSK